MQCGQLTFFIGTVSGHKALFISTVVRKFSFVQSALYYLENYTKPNVASFQVKSRNLNILLCILPTFCTPVGVQCRFRLLSSSRQKIGYFVLLNRFPQCVMSALLGACNSHATRGICTDQSIFRYFSRQISQFQSTSTRFGKDKTMWPDRVIMWTSHVDISWLLKFLWGSEFEINGN